MKLSATDMARAQAGTIRLKLLKIGAVVIRNTRRVSLHLSSACSDKALFAGQRAPLRKPIPSDRRHSVHRLSCRKTAKSSDRPPTQRRERPIVSKTATPGPRTSPETSKRNYPTNVRDESGLNRCAIGR